MRCISLPNSSSERSLTQPTDHGAVGEDTERHMAAALIEHGANRRHGFSARSPRGLELPRFRFAGFH